jgi:uncharacterized protein YeaO (DUF488 family)
LGTVRRPPCGVPKAEHASRDFYDVWLPDLAPSVDLVKEGLHASDEREWGRLARRLLQLLAALSHGMNMWVGCYCAEEARCHLSVLKALLKERETEVV